MLNWFSGKRILVVIGFLMGISGVGLALAANRTGSTNLNPTTTTRVQAGSITTTTIGNSSLGPGPALSAAIRAENLRPGTTSWRISGPQIRNSISGYASTVSIFAGGSFKIYVSTIEPNFNVTAYRMGWYGGDLARMVWQSPTIKGLNQPSCPVTPANNTVECSWRPSLTIHTNQNWFPGDYLLLLTVDAYPLIELRIWGPEILQLVVPGLRFSALIAAVEPGADLASPMDHAC